MSQPTNGNRHREYIIEASFDERALYDEQPMQDNDQSTAQQGEPIDNVINNDRREESQGQHQTAEPIQEEQMAPAQSDEEASEEVAMSSDNNNNNSSNSTEAAIVATEMEAIIILLIQLFGQLVTVIPLHSTDPTVTSFEDYIRRLNTLLDTIRAVITVDVVPTAASTDGQSASPPERATTSSRI